MKQELRCPIADVNHQATVGGISKDTLLDFGLCVSWDRQHPYGFRITGKKGLMRKFFDTHNCITYSEMEPVKTTRTRNTEEQNNDFS